ncbi:hypothetical protein VHEMI05961 [[Torrubiella] hemipterigena]|uniref:DUF7924 domain-containing protein n=1 Tax=[Torrubiella] hemipterigena TaxID=1531966 RepID=A0A0A1TI08_9HYPO|nr:hypothetical protein VHEMI05961 [[Torrubiella] hemipterigena]
MSSHVGRRLTWLPVPPHVLCRESPSSFYFQLGSQKDHISTIMSSTTRKTKKQKGKEREAIHSDLNIEFVDPFDPRTTSEGLEYLRRILDDIYKAGRCSIKKYTKRADEDVAAGVLNSWRGDTLKRAMDISGMACKCFKSKDPEIHWRMQVESQAMYRLQREVACMRCGQRLWVSEVQAQPSIVKREDGRLPEDRPNSRKVCECVPDFTENGLTKIFASTADAQTSYNPEAQKRIGKERPDAVYGLQRTRRFEELLRGLPEPNARCTIYENNKIIFPFRILEAKSETSKDNFHDINNQTGLAISEMLNLQIELFKLAGRSYGENVGPIVWYIATRGDLWKIHVAYVNMVKDKPQYQVRGVWDGCVCFPERALQLTLIVDYIADWARKIYRNEITACLETFRQSVARSTASIARDTPVESQEHHQDHMELNIEINGFGADTDSDLYGIELDSQSVDGCGSKTSVHLDSAPVSNKDDKLQISNTGDRFKFVGITITRGILDDLFHGQLKSGSLINITDILGVILQHSFQMDEMNLVWESPYLDNSFKRFISDMADSVFALSIYRTRACLLTKLTEVHFVAVENDIIPLFWGLSGREPPSRHGTRYFLKLMGYLFTPEPSRREKCINWFCQIRSLRR